MARARAGRFSAELKFLDCAFNAVAINNSTDGASGEIQPSSGCTGALSVPAQGDGESQRDGRKYTITSIWVSGMIEQAGDTAQTSINESQGYWFALVLDTQANGATIVSENVFINPSTNGNAILPQPLRNLQNSKRYRVLAKTYIPPAGLTTGQDAATPSFAVGGQYAPTMSIGWKGKIICDSTGTTADVSSASDNAIHLIGYRGSNYTATLVGKSRVRFYG